MLASVDSIAVHKNTKAILVRTIVRVLSILYSSQTKSHMQVHIIYEYNYYVVYIFYC